MTDEELEWQKACEAELNFEKALDMAMGFPPIKSEEDYKFVVKWLVFCLSKENESRENINPRLHS